MKNIILLTFIFLIILSGCNVNTPNNNAKPTIKIGYLPITHSANLMMTKEIQQNTHHSNYNLKLVRFNNWPDLLDALNSGKIDGASTLIELAMKSKQKGSDLKAVALGHHEGNVVMARKDKKRSDFHDHERYHFARPHRYSTHYLLLDEMRKQLKLRSNTFSYHEMPPAEMPAALNEGSISGYSVAEPFGALGKKLGSGHTLLHGSDIIPDAYCCVLVLRSDLINQHQTVIQSFMSDYKRAGFQMADKNRSIEIMNKNFKQDKKVLSQSAEWTSYGNLAIDKQGYNKIKKLVEEKKLFQAPDYQDFVDPTLYKE
ncbi:ABC transporter substrate-binding protein [Staphylococcus sp. IVB6214]|uniref:ABC transporter substrate-binding protein n=1 Tax=Staphylococcus sp. IVB6214 TaxID=2989766 RepID=UPI0021D0A049|nr:ABC transporter substrate-binding protein [Staphylococcus sp. IVB6214]UXR82774.1 ABC transporter substrate-binding protein [Staphylococcus sp. IVB6214]